MKSMLICLIFLTAALADPNYPIRNMVCTTQNQCTSIIDNPSTGTTTCVDMGEGEDDVCACDTDTDSGWLIYSAVFWDETGDVPDDASLTCYKAVGASCSNEADCMDEDSALSVATCNGDSECVCGAGANEYEGGAFCEPASSASNQYACKSEDQCDELVWYGNHENEDQVECGGDDDNDRHCFCVDDGDILHESYLYSNDTVVHSCGRAPGSACDDEETEANEGYLCQGLPNGMCDDNDECVCDDGYFLTNNNNDCVKYATIDDGFACQNQDQCSHIANHENLETGVLCTNNVCTCPDGDYSLQRVVEDQDIYACYVDFDCTGSDDTCDDITDNAFTCKHDVALVDDELDKKCQCDGGYIAPNSDSESDEDYMCVDYASAETNECEDDLQCSIIVDQDADSGFAGCVEDACACTEENKFVYSDENTPLQCVLLLGEDCVSADDCKIADSTCNDVCVCNDGYEAESDNRSCSGAESAVVVSLMTLLLGLLINKLS